MKQGKTGSKITITPDLVNQIIPLDFSNPEPEEPKNDQAELAKISQELAKLQSKNGKLAGILSKNQAANNQQLDKLTEIEQKNKDLKEEVKELEKNFQKDSLNRPANYG